MRVAEAGMRVAEEGMQSAETGVQYAEVGITDAEVRAMNAEDGMQNPEAGATKAETGARRRAPGIVAQKVIDRLSQSERLADVARKPVHAPRLAPYGVDAAFVASFVQNLDDCRAGIATLADKKAGRSAATGSEGAERTTLLNGLQEAQALAKLRLTLHPTETALKARYFIGSTLRTMSRADLESAAERMIAHLKTDNLTGMDVAKLSALESSLTAWRSADRTQGGERSGAITTRGELMERFAEVERQRRAIQLAADAAFPYTDKSNGGVRSEFGLPKNGPVKGTA